MTKKKLAPIVGFREHEPFQDDYHDGNDVYAVSRLIDTSKDLPVFDVPLAALDLSDIIWENSNVYQLASHVKRVVDADLDCPIILDWNGAIADGRHRIMQALVKGHRTIKAVRITWKMIPDSISNKKD